MWGSLGASVRMHPSASVGAVSVEASVGTASLGTASLGRASLGTASLGAASLGASVEASVGASVEASVGAASVKFAAKQRFGDACSPLVGFQRLAFMLPR